MSKKRADRNTHPVQIPDDLWQVLWQEARKRPKPTTPSQVLKELIEKLSLKKMKEAER